jgi:hypothetical protein
MSKKQKQQKKVVLAKGEVTGHAHVAAGPDLMFDEATKILTVPEGAVVTHEEHHQVTLPKGKFKIGIVQEEDPYSKELRKVRD